MTDAPDSSSFAPVLRPREQVESQLRAAILDGTFDNGDRLPSEANLSEQFKVSRATIREALRSLHTAGLISTVPGSRGGSFITYFDHRKLADLVSDRLANTLELGSISYDEVTAFRYLLEVPAARLAALHRTADQVAHLRRVFERGKAIPVDDPRVYDEHAEFHLVIAEMSGNRLLSAFIDTSLRVTDPLNRVHAPSVRLAPDTNDHHEMILKAIADADEDAAERSMREHLDILRDFAAEHSGRDGRGDAAASA